MIDADRLVFGPGLEVLLPSQKMIPGTKLYMAGPQGFMEATRPFHNSVVELVRRMGGFALDPWVLTPDEIIQNVINMPLGKRQMAAWRRANRIIDSGTAAEIGAAFILGKPIVGYRGDFRLARDNLGGIVNLQVEYFIRESGEGRGNIIESISQLPHELLRVWGES